MRCLQVITWHDTEALLAFLTMQSPGFPAGNPQATSDHACNLQDQNRKARVEAAQPRAAAAVSPQPAVLKHHNSSVASELAEQQHLHHHQPATALQPEHLQAYAHSHVQTATSVHQVSGSDGIRLPPEGRSVQPVDPTCFQKSTAAMQPVCNHAASCSHVMPSEPQSSATHEGKMS